MKQFAMTENLSCIYCGEAQDGMAQDFLAFIPRFNPQFGEADYDESVTQEQCCNCDQIFFLKFVKSEKKVVACNLPFKFYECV